MLSARELSYPHLQSRIWINEHLTFTHGYGVVVGPVNRITPEGLPEFVVKDIPPQSSGGLAEGARPPSYLRRGAHASLPVTRRPHAHSYPPRRPHPPPTH